VSVLAAARAHRATLRSCDVDRSHLAHHGMGSRTLLQGDPSHELVRTLVAEARGAPQQVAQGVLNGGNVRATSGVLTRVARPNATMATRRVAFARSTK